MAGSGCSKSGAVGSIMGWSLLLELGFQNLKWNMLCKCFWTSWIVYSKEFFSFNLFYFLFPFLSVLPIEMITIQRKMLLHPQHPLEMLPWGHHSSARWALGDVVNVSPSNSHWFQCAWICLGRSVVCCALRHPPSAALHHQVGYEPSGNHFPAMPLCFSAEEPPSIAESAAVRCSCPGCVCESRTADPVEMWVLLARVCIERAPTRGSWPQLAPPVLSE